MFSVFSTKDWEMCWNTNCLCFSHFFYYDKSWNGKMYSYFREKFPHLNSFLPFMYCDQKKNSFRGNWLQKYGVHLTLEGTNSIETNFRTCNVNLQFKNCKKFSIKKKIIFFHNRRNGFCLLSFSFSSSAQNIRRSPVHFPYQNISISTLNNQKMEMKPTFIWFAFHSNIIFAVQLVSNQIIRSWP